MRDAVVSDQANFFVGWAEVTFVKDGGPAYHAGVEASSGTLAHVVGR